MLNHAVWAWLVVSAAIAISDDYRYCTVRYRRLCQGKGRHVGCQFPEAGPGLSCENYTEIEFNDELKHFVSHYINRRRQRLASGNERVRGGAHLPKPQIMMLVEWDRELAFLAQRLADQCHFVHDDCRATVRYPYAGQTVGEVRWRKSSDSEALSALRGIRRVLDAWWGERRRVQPRQLTSPFRLTPRGAVWGHFTQLAVWTLRAVGCGAVRHGHPKPRLLLVCDFSHTNMLGQRTISPGHVAPCPMHTERRSRSQYPLLCGPLRQPTEKKSTLYEDDEFDDTDDMTPREELEARTKSIYTAVTKDAKDFEKGKILVATKPVIIDKLEQELAKKKGEHKSYEGHLQTTTRRQLTTRRYFGKWRENQETVDEGLVEDEPRTYSIVYQRSMLTLEPTRPTVILRETPPRVRWKQTRDRPTRPGANALLNLETSNAVVAARRQSAVSTYVDTKRIEKIARVLNASLVLDKDDVDQLFKDTGFSIPSKEPNHQHQHSS